ncbi:DUF192 domain-containing protein [Maricaulis sp. CAU 1757]
MHDLTPRFAFTAALAGFALISASTPVWSQVAEQTAPANQASDEAAPSAVDPTAQDTQVIFGGPEAVVIHSGDASHTFMAELATRPDQLQRGLMWRDSVDPAGGMLFRYEPPRRAAMWMENTLVPLDLVFIEPDGRIAKIIAFAQPGSRRGLSSDGVVAGVLELAAGRTLELGIQPGDRVEHGFFAAPESPAPAAPETLPAEGSADSTEQDEAEAAATDAQDEAQ